MKRTAVFFSGAVVAVALLTMTAAVPYPCNATQNCTVKGLTANGDAGVGKNLNVGGSITAVSATLTGTVTIADAGATNATFSTLMIPGTAHIAALDAGIAATGTSLARSISDRFAEVANVKDYGAKGDGTTDDSAAFAAAVSALATAKGGTLFVPAGVYKVNFSVATSNVAVLGVGAGTDVLGSRGGSVLIPNSNASPVVTLGDGTADVRMLEVARLSVWGDNAGATSDCVRILGALDVSIHDVALVNAGRDALRLESSATKATAYVDVSRARIMWARGAGIRAIYGTSGVLAVFVSDSMVEGWTTGYLAYLDAVQLRGTNTWMQAAASHYGVYLKNEGGTLAKLLGTRTLNVDSDLSTDALITFDATTTHNVSPWSYVSPEVSVDGVAEWLSDATTIAMGAFGYAPTAVWPYVTGRLAFQPNDLATPTTPNPAWYLYGMDSGGAPALYLTGAAFRGDFTFAHPLQSASPQAALWFDTTAKYLRVRRGSRIAGADSDGEVVPLWKASAPATLTDACYVGEMAHDATRVYVCIATNTWGVASFYTPGTHAALDLANVAFGACSAEVTETLAATLGTSTCSVSAGVDLQGGFIRCAVSAANQEKWSFCNLTGAPIDLPSTTYSIYVQH